MYDRYVIKRKRGGFLRVIVVAVLAVAAVWGAWHYRKYFLFWQYTDNALITKMDTARRSSPRARQAESLADLTTVFERHREQNPLNPEPCQLNAELQYRIGESLLPGTFTELVVNDRVNQVPRKARRAFLRSIRLFRKSAALLDKDAQSPRHALMVARACYVTRYAAPRDILTTLGPVDPAAVTDVEDLRFLTLLQITAGMPDAGLRTLRQYGAVQENILGRLFLGTAERLGKQYTGAIITLKDVLGRTEDPGLLKLTRINLGKAYFSQSLYRESIEQFSEALKIDDRDSTLKIWLGKNYAAMGEKDRARAILKEVQSTDDKNIEVRELLRVM